MCKLINRLICLVVFAIIALAALSLYSGGENLRWFGREVQGYSEKLAEMADIFKKKSEDAVKCIDKAKDKVQDLLGDKDGKPDKR
ncbi:MAG: hypothetical protein AABY42_03860 [Nitrospirota bacterium]